MSFINLYSYFLKLEFFNKIKIFFICRPKYRYPFYDENGKGRILYGYGGPDLYQYKTYTALEGIH